MITATQLSRNYPSLWKRIFPFLSRLVRKFNLQKNSFDDQMLSIIDSSRRALVNEIGFKIFEELVSSTISDPDSINKKKLRDIIESTCEYISILERVDEKLELDTDELPEAFNIARRTLRYFNLYEKGSILDVSPFFSGCGIVSDCYGDVLVGDTLYEIKSGEREFRISDLKQLLIYITLNFSMRNTNISNVAILNPRLGIFVKITIKEFLELSSGKSTIDTFNELINFFDNTDDFR